MARYGRKASEKVKKAMRERKRGTLRSGRWGGEDQPKTGDCHWTVGGQARQAEKFRARRQRKNSILTLG